MAESESESESAAIPVIDMKDFPGQLHQLIEACEEWGCFRIVNFQNFVPKSLMQEMKGVVRSLLDLPTEVKRRNVEVIAGTGYMAPSKINPLYEALGLYDMASVEDVDAFCDLLEASPHQRETIIGYARAIHELMMEIGRRIGEGLGVKNVPYASWACQFRINKYTFTPESVGSSGVQLHTDSGLLTVLQDDEVIGGLEVMRKSGRFVAIDPCPDTLLVNLGDMAKIWSNGRFCNVKHRVLCKEAGIRLSIASFLLGPKEGPVETPLELVDAQHPRLYVPFTYEEYRKFRISKKLATGEGVDHFRAES